MQDSMFHKFPQMREKYVPCQRLTAFTRLRRKPPSPDGGGMRVSADLSAEAAGEGGSWPTGGQAKEDWSFGGLRRTAGATGSCPWGSTF